MIDINVVLIGVLSLLPIIILRVTGKYVVFAAFSLIAILYHGLYFFGPGILWLLVGTYVISTLAELISLKTPIYCFGVKYQYNLKHHLFASKIFLMGVYPLEISLTWVILKYVSFIVVLLIVSAFSLSVVWEIFLIPLILVSLDFMFDPVSVHTYKLWKWERGSKYFGIPWQNFLGWYVVGLLSTLLFFGMGNTTSFIFHPLHALGPLFYGSFLSNVVRLRKLDPILGTIGSLPAIFWTFLGFVSFLLLYIR